MKSTVLFSVFFFLTTITFAQEGFKGEHFIEVSGTARQEVEPNEIYVNVQLREFEENREKVSLEKLDKEFWDAIKNASIDRKKVTIANVGSQFGKLGRKDKDAFREKTYQVILSSGAELEKLLEKVEPVKVNQITLTKITHTELEKYRLELKVKALQAAKAKADALLKSIGSEMGKTLMVREFENYYPMDNMATNVMVRSKANYEAAGDMPAEDPTAFRKITLQAQVTAQFEIK
ncbi:SIMPL domain-containing protein [Ohtaekwangia kribbensis]|jgi:uncharacterized protein YggE|uniref:SIMPL domain-containing protein n=1 Tax=Ohtaekwangia kribbensis TaxID=688913 RepID=A0ABW3K9X8_9BACT